MSMRNGYAIFEVASHERVPTHAPAQQMRTSSGHDEQPPATPRCTVQVEGLVVGLSVGCRSVLALADQEVLEGQWRNAKLRGERARLMNYRCRKPQCWIGADVTGKLI
jgi:hypothetical protein